MMVNLSNKTSAVRVIYDINGRAQTIPPGAAIDMLLTPQMIARLRRAQEKGDKLLVGDVDFQPMDDDPPPHTPVPPAKEAPANVTSHEFRDIPASTPPASDNTPRRRNNRRRS